MTCLLCGSSNTVETEQVPPHALAQLYRRRMNIAIDHLLEGVDYLAYALCNDCDLRFFDPPITGDGSFYRSLQEFGWYYMEEKPEYEYASHDIHEDDAVLEVGCGKGAFAPYIPTDSYVGLELSDEAVQQAKEYGLDVRNQLVEDHANDHPEAYDVVCGFQVLEHVDAVDSFLEACVACLKPGGLLMMAVPSWDSFLACATNNQLNLPPHHVTHWSDRALRSIGERYGLDLVDLHHEKVTDFHFVWFSKIFGMHVLSSWLRHTPCLVDRSLKQRLIAKVGGKMGQAIAKGWHPKLLPNGHTVTASYTK